MISHNFVCNLRPGQVVQIEDRHQRRLQLDRIAVREFHMRYDGRRLEFSPACSSARESPSFHASPCRVSGRISSAAARDRGELSLGSMITFLAEAEDTEHSRACCGQLHTVRGSPFPAALQERVAAGALACGEGRVEQLRPHRGGTKSPRLRLGEEAPGLLSGRANADFDVRIFDEDDNELPARNARRDRRAAPPSNYHVRGYWNRPADTLKILRNLLAAQQRYRQVR